MSVTQAPNACVLGHRPVQNGQNRRGGAPHTWLAALILGWDLFSQRFCRTLGVLQFNRQRVAGRSCKRY